MSTKLEINEKILEGTNVSLHYLPASIDGNGPSNVKQYFSQYTREDDNGIFENSLRGYPLKGCQFKIPEGYKGIVFQEAKKHLDSDHNRTFKAAGKFDSFIYWNYDKLPSSNDPLNQAMDVLYLSEMISKSISDDDIEKEIEEKRKKETQN